MGKDGRPNLDNAYEWLLSHLNFAGLLTPRQELATKVGGLLKSRIETGSLPCTVGVALLAKELEDLQNNRVIYFNAWKYAGFMEIVRH